MSELIERLRREAEISARPGQMDRLNQIADEFRAARDGWAQQHHKDSAELRRLCAERDRYRANAERYQWLRDRMAAEEIADEAHAIIALRVVGPIAKRPADPDYCGELDAAIDQARGKGVAE